MGARIRLPLVIETHRPSRRICTGAHREDAPCDGEQEARGARSDDGGGQPRRHGRHLSGMGDPRRRFAASSSVPKSGTSVAHTPLDVPSKLRISEPPATLPASAPGAGFTIARTSRTVPPRELRRRPRPPETRVGRRGSCARDGEAHALRVGGDPSMHNIFALQKLAVYVASHDFAPSGPPRGRRRRSVPRSAHKSAASQLARLLEGPAQIALEAIRGGCSSTALSRFQTGNVDREWRQGFQTETPDRR